jgi:hypothetical protein
MVDVSVRRETVDSILKSVSIVSRPQVSETILVASMRSARKRPKSGLLLGVGEDAAFVAANIEARDRNPENTSNDSHELALGESATTFSFVDSSRSSGVK